MGNWMQASFLSVLWDDEDDDAGRVMAVSYLGLYWMRSRISKRKRAFCFDKIATEFCENSFGMKMLFVGPGSYLVPVLYWEWGEEV